MDFGTFDQSALEMWKQIPRRFRDGVSALCVEENAKFDPEFPEVCLMGECVSDPMTDFPGAPVRSLIYIYYGSFCHAAQKEGDFPWEDEIWETLTHELLHHLEWTAGYDALGTQDDIQRENIARRCGEEFYPDFYRHGLHLERGVYQADGCLFVEVRMNPDLWKQLAAGTLRVQCLGMELKAPATGAARRGSQFVTADAEVQDDGRIPWYEVVLVLRSERSLLRWLRR